MRVPIALSIPTTLAMKVMPIIALALLTGPTALLVDGSIMGGMTGASSRTTAKRTTAVREAMSQLAISPFTSRNAALDRTQPHRRLVAATTETLSQGQTGIRDLLSIGKTDPGALTGPETLIGEDGEVTMRDVLVKTEPIDLGRRGTVRRMLGISHARGLRGVGEGDSAYYCIAGIFIGGLTTKLVHPLITALMATSEDV